MISSLKKHIIQTGINSKPAKRYYQSIDDLPVWNYWKIQDTENLGYLYKDDVPRKSLISHLFLDYIWQEIQNQFQEEFGSGNRSSYYLDKIRKLMISKMDQVIFETENPKHPKLSRTKMNIRMLEKELMDSNKSSGQSLDQMVAYLEKYMGIAINTKIVSVKRFYTYVQMYQKQVNEFEMKHQKTA